MQIPGNLPAIGSQQNKKHQILRLVQALPPWVYEPIISLGFSLLVVTRPHTDTDPMIMSRYGPNQK